ncbi:MAG: flagellar basal body rod protein FlgC [Janthinobacterium lividum]
MHYTDTFLISATGMAIERSRVDIAALNLANANAVQDANGVTYQPARVLVRGAGTAPFAPAFANLFGAFQGAGEAAPEILALLPTATLETVPTPARQVHEPAHPLASKEGFVAYANVDTATEMVSLLNASRAYEANVAAFNASRSLALKALDIGRGN